MKCSFSIIAFCIAIFTPSANALFLANEDDMASVAQPYGSPENTMSYGDLPELDKEKIEQKLVDVLGLMKFESQTVYSQAFRSGCYIAGHAALWGALGYFLHNQGIPWLDLAAVVPYVTKMPVWFAKLLQNRETITDESIKKYIVGNSFYLKLWGPILFLCLDATHTVTDPFLPSDSVKMAIGHVCQLLHDAYCFRFKEENKSEILSIIVRDRVSIFSIGETRKSGSDENQDRNTFILVELINDVSAFELSNDVHVFLPACDQTCSICSDNYLDEKDKAIAKVASCRHFFHKDCIASWINQKSKQKCPLCREGIGALILIKSFSLDV